MCNGRAVGKIGTNQYFCWECLVEYDCKNQIYEVQEDGSLINFKEHLS